MATATTPPIPAALEDRVVNDEPISAEAYLHRERTAAEERREYVDGG